MTIQLYKSYDEWLNAFNTDLYGYHRTFNISEYSEASIDLKRQMLLSYQPLQTIFFTEEERKNICEYSITKYKRICTDVDEFIKYRSLTSFDDPDDKSKLEDIPPYYKALIENKNLFKDSYIRGKIKDDIKGLKDKLLSGKTFLEGNYQVLTVDVYAMLEYVFDLPVVGLLQKDKIYSNYWNQRLIDMKNKDKEVDIIRNPHIATEHRIGKLSNSEKMKEWYKYQDTGIITSIHDTVLLALNSADADGDHIGTISDKSIIQAVKREVKEGHARTIDYKPLQKNNKDMGLRTDDTLGLMHVNMNSFKNDIGDVVNEISKLWSMELTEEVRDAIKIMSIIGSLTIDFAKTGEIAEIPDSIKKMLKGIKKPHFMRYFPKNSKAVTKEKRAIGNLIGLSKKDDLEMMESAKRFSDTDCNVNLLSHYYETELAAIDIEMDSEDDNFCISLIQNACVPINRKIKTELEQLHLLFQEYSRSYNMSFCKSSDEKRDCNGHYNYFYTYCRERLLLIESNIDKLLDVLLKIYYTCPEYESRSKDILWNSFSKEMMNRINNNSNILNLKEEIANRKTLTDKKEAKAKRARENSLQKRKSSSVTIKTLDSDKYRNNKIIFTDADKKNINKAICSNNGIIGINSKNVLCVRRLFAMLLIISRKLDPEKSRYFAKSNKQNEINDSVLSKLAKIDKRKILPALSVLENLKLIKIDTRNMAEIKIKVLYDNQSKIEYNELYNGTDYNKAASVIRYGFR